MWSTFSLTLQGPLVPGVVVLVRLPSINQIELFDLLAGIIINVK